MHLNHHILIPALFLLLMSCARLRQSIDHISFACGLSREAAQEGSYVKVLSTTGASLEPVDPSNLKLSFAMASGETIPLIPNVKGCVKLPEASGRLLASAQQPRATLVLDHAEGSSDRLRELKLQPDPEVNLALNCNDDGFYANDHFRHPISIESQGYLAGIRFTMEASRAEDPTQTYTIFLKDFGEDAIALPAVVDVSPLPEGVYNLEAGLHKLTDGHSKRPQSQGTQRNCRLTVIRQIPHNPGLALPPQTLPVLPLNSVVPFKESSVETQKYICREEVEPPAGESAAASCEVRRACLDPGNFKASAHVDTDQPGHFNYFVYTEDRAKNRSPISCQTLIVSPRAPLLEVKWLKDHWNTDGASVMEAPYANLEARVVTLSHPHVPTEKLLSRLSCKVEFELPGQMLLKGSQTYCTRGRCQGMSMGDFVPCDEHIAFTIKDAWQQKAIRNSYVRIVVKADDEAGQEIVASQSVWLNDGKWKVTAQETMSFDNFNMNLSLTSFLSLDTDGQLVVGTTQGQFAYQDKLKDWEDVKWHIVQPPRAGNLHADFLKTSDGAIWGHWKIPDTTGPEAGSNFWFARWDRTQWQYISEGHQAYPPFPCLALKADNRGNIWCVNIQNDLASHRTTAVDLARFDGRMWKRLPSIKLGEGTGVSLNSLVIQTNGSTSWAITSSYVYRSLNDSSWDPLLIDGSRDIINTGHARVDSEGKLWIVRQNETLEFAIGFLDDHGAFQPVGGTRNSRAAVGTFSTDAQGNIHFKSRIWNSAQGIWMDHPVLAPLLTQDEFIRAEIDFAGNTVWRTKKGLFAETPRGLVYWPLDLYSIDSIGLSNYDFLFTYDGQGHIWIHSDVASVTSNLISLKVNPHFFIDRNVSGLPPSTDTMLGVWDSASKGLQFVTNTSHSTTIVNYKDGLWTSEDADLPMARLALRSSTGAIYFVDYGWVAVKKADGSGEDLPSPALGDGDEIFGLIEKSTGSFYYGGRGNKYFSRHDGTQLQDIPVPFVNESEAILYVFRDGDYPTILSESRIYRYDSRAGIFESHTYQDLGIDPAEIQGYAVKAWSDHKQNLVFQFMHEETFDVRTYAVDFKTKTSFHMQSEASQGFKHMGSVVEVVWTSKGDAYFLLDEGGVIKRRADGSAMHLIDYHTTFGTTFDYLVKTALVDSYDRLWCVNLIGGIFRIDMENP